MLEQTLPKPLFGEPCNGCGFCCMRSLCPIGASVFGDPDPVVRRVFPARAPCPALTKRDDGSFGCGVIMHPDKYPGTERAIQKFGVAQVIADVSFFLGITSRAGCDAVSDAEEGTRRYKKARAAMQAVHHAIPDDVLEPIIDRLSEGELL